MLTPIEHVSMLDLRIASRIRHYRVSAGFTQEQLAVAIGVSFQQLQKYEKGINRVSAGRSVLICTTLELDIQEMAREDHS
jgi:transcriptional regulator with XRE-family HTH domain